MPTRITKLGRERSIATLARKIFEIEGPTGSAAQLRAEAALLAANPSLATPDGFRPGAAVIVPNVAGLQPSADILVAKADENGLTGEVSLRLQASAVQVGERFAASQKRAKETAAQLTDDAFLKQLRTALPDVEPLISKARDALEKQQAANEEKRAMFQGAIEEAIEGVETLQALAKSTRAK